MTSKLDIQRRAQYILNRVEMLKSLKKHREVIERIALHGIKTEEEEVIAKTVCCMIASEYHYDDAVLNDRTGTLDNTEIG